VRTAGRFKGGCIVLKWSLVVAFVLLASVCVGAESESPIPVGAKILPLGVAGTAWADLEPGVRGGSFIFHGVGNPKRWNPTTAVETSTTLITNLIYHGMVDLHPVTGQLEPALAERWDVSEDELVLTFHLRHGLFWSDGEPFTADDVLFTFNDVILNDDVTTGDRDLLCLPDGSFPVIEKLDPYTVRVTTSVVFRPLLSAMGRKILPKHTLERYVHKLNPEVEPGTFDGALGLDVDVSEIVGMGPYVVESFVPDQHVVLRRNPYYYVYDANGTQLPYYDRRIVLIVPSYDVALLKFLNGELDAFAPDTSDVPYLAEEAEKRGFTVKVDPQVATYGTSWIAFNQDVGLADGTDDAKRELYRDLKFRQAFAHLIDKDAIIDVVYDGLAVAQWSPLSFGSPFYAGRDAYAGAITESSAVTFGYDLNEAKRLFDEIGLVDLDGDGWRDLGDGSRLSITLSSVSGMTEAAGVATIVTDRARQAGLDFEFVPGEALAVLTSMSGGTFDALFLSFTGGNEPNSLGSVYRPGGSLHFWRRSAAEEPTDADLALAALLDAGASTMDDDEAFAVYRDFQRQAAEDAGLIYTVYSSFRYAYYDYVGNADVASPNGHATGHSGNAADFIYDRRLAP
jgi:peptide/nickel transport system substrate-binding protein